MGMLWGITGVARVLAQEVTDPGSTPLATDIEKAMGAREGAQGVQEGCDVCVCVCERTSWAEQIANLRHIQMGGDRVVGPVIKKREGKR